MILIAGAVAPASFWDESFCETLAKDHLVLRFDNRDFGHSLDGSIAQLFAIQYPARILSITVISSPINAWDNT